MNRRRIFIVAAAGLCAAVWTYACGDGATEPPTPPPDPPRPATVAVAPATIRLTALGATEQLTAEVRDQNGNAMAGAAVSWASSAAAVATVSASGLVTAGGNGTATITATAGSASGSATVTVAQEVSAVAVSPAIDTLFAGDTLRLAAEATDANGRPVAGTEFDWASSDTLVAVVDDAGRVTGVGAGEAEVTATAAGVAGRAELTVVAPAPTSVAVTPDTVALTALGQTAQLAAEVRDQIGRVMEGVRVSWSSADATVAAVDSAGLVTAADIGVTTVTATVGEVSGAALVTVMQSAGSVIVSPPTDTIAPGDTLRLLAEAYDENGHPVESAQFSWSASDGSVATVDTSGLVLGVGEGTATITATAGSARGTAVITVTHPARTVASFSTMTTAIPEGDTAVLVVALDPSPETSITLGYTLGVDTDVDTNDADPRDYAGGYSGSVEVGAGETTTAIAVAISDDADIEPTREVFTIVLDTPTSNDGYVLGSARSALVTINEGVCDRTPQIRDEILAQATMADCTEVADEILSRISTLDLCFPDIPGYCDAGNAVRFDAIATLLDGDFQGLSQLRTLNLHSNRLSELPPEVFHSLSNLRSLNLGGNRLTGLPDRIFASLSGLTSLDLQGNRLTELPATLLSGLSELQWVTFYRNELTELPPGLFTSLTGSVVLDFDGNPGSPFPLTAKVERVDQEDATPPGPAMLQVKLAEGAPMELTVSVSALGGTLSAETVSLAVGATASSTITLTPDTASLTGVSATVGDVPDLQAVCEHCRGLVLVPGDPLVVADPDSLELRIPAAYVTQGVQDLDNGVPLISGRQAMLRVFVNAQAPTSFKVGGRATFLMGAQEIHSVELEPIDERIPTSVDESRMGLSLNARIPAPMLRNGLSLVVELNPGDAVPTTSTSHDRFPLSGQLDLNVVDIPPMHLTIVPILYRSEANRQTNTVVSEFAHDLATADSRSTLPYTRAILPVGDLKVRLREPYYTSADADTGTDGIYTLLSEMSMLRHLDDPSGNEYYHGVFAPPIRRDPDLNWSGGVARLSGYSAVSNYVPPDRPSWTLFTHELGHNLSLGHAPCGQAGGVDPDFPYRDGSIGVWGHTFLDAANPKLGRLFHPANSRDIMGYCNTPWTTWISDYNFTLALAHRLQVESSAAAVQDPEPRRTLLLWGGVQEGALRLEPAFAHDARLKLPAASGPYQLDGLDRQGRKLFSLSFRPDELDHGGSSFLFAIPFETEWTKDLERITLTGPEGSTTLDRDTGGRAVLIIDRASGRVRTISRGWSDGYGSQPAAMAANAQVKIIRGLPRR